MSAALLTVAEAAAFLRGRDTPANRALVGRLIADGKLEAQRVGRRWMVSKPCIEDFLSPRGLAPAGGAGFPKRRVGRGPRRAA